MAREVYLDTMATQLGQEEMTGLQKCHRCKQRRAKHKDPAGTVCILLDVEPWVQIKAHKASLLVYLPMHYVPR